MDSSGPGIATRDDRRDNVLFSFLVAAAIEDRLDNFAISSTLGCSEAREKLSGAWFTDERVFGTGTSVKDWIDEEEDREVDDEDEDGFELDDVTDVEADTFLVDA
jgi:hypothetical protein